MKKFLKVFIIVLLVLCAIGGTVYFFFKNMKEKNSNTGSIVGMLLSEQKINFNQSLNEMNSIVNSDGTDTRLNLLVTTNEKLDSIVYALSTYLVEDNTNVNSEEVAKALRETNSSRETLIKMMAEYNIKKDSEYFNRHKGANDFYEEMCGYLIDYANFTSLLNDYITDVNKNADIKFSMIEVYTDVVADAFAVLQTSSGLIKIQDASNINIVNSKMNINKTYLTTSGSQFSANNNKFIEYYNKCDKQQFAENLATNIYSVTSVGESSTDVQIATYYFKLVFGM